MSNDLWNLRDSTRQSRNWIFYGTSETCLSETGKSKISLSRDIPRVDRISREVQSDLEKRIDSKKKKIALTAARFRVHCYKHSSHSSGTYNTIIFKYIYSVVCSLVSSTLHHLTIRLTHEFRRRTVHLGAIRYGFKITEYPTLYLLFFELWFSSPFVSLSTKRMNFFAQSTRCTVRRLPPGWPAVCPSNTIQVKLRSNIHLDLFFFLFLLVQMKRNS